MLREESSAISQEWHEASTCGSRSARCLPLSLIVRVRAASSGPRGAEVALGWWRERPSVESLACPLGDRSRDAYSSRVAPSSPAFLVQRQDALARSLTPAKSSDRRYRRKGNAAGNWLLGREQGRTPIYLSRRLYVYARRTGQPPCSFSSCRRRRSQEPRATDSTKQSRKAARQPPSLPSLPFDSSTPPICSDRLGPRRWRSSRPEIPLT